MRDVSMIDGHIDEPKGMSDNEIIKALGGVSYGGHSCTKCKYKITKGEDRCGLKGCKIAREALDLINRQKAEIENLNTLVVYNASCATRLHKELFDVRVEAIKEFAERLKEEAEECGRIDFNGYTYCAVGLHHIDNLVKEMVGDTE